MSAVFLPLNTPLSGSPAKGKAAGAKPSGKRVAPVKQVGTVKTVAPAKPEVRQAKPKVQPKGNPAGKAATQGAAFNPNLPIAGTPILAEPLRDQFNSLKALIDAVPTVNGAVVEGVETVAPGAGANVQVGLSAGLLRFNFWIPQGWQGQQGETGAQGPAFSNAVVNGVQTLPAGSSAWVTSWFDGTTVHLTFGIPVGYNGADGANGAQGPEGPMGPQGPTGEVTPGQLNNAIQGTSNNSNGVGQLSMSADWNYNQGQIQMLMNKMDELISALRR